MKMEKHILLLLICFSSLVYSQMQEATLYFLDGTSWEGLGKIVPGHKIKFKFFDEDKPDVWTYLVVKGVTFHDYYEGDRELRYVYLKKDDPLRKQPILIVVFFCPTKL